MTRQKVPRETPRISISKKTTPHPMVSLNQTQPATYTRGKEAMSIACHPSPRTDIQENSTKDKSKNKVRNQTETKKTQVFQQCPSNADVYRFRL